MVVPEVGMTAVVNVREPRLQHVTRITSVIIRDNHADGACPFRGASFLDQRAVAVR